ncbi:MAG: YciI family protein [Ignavibacteriales bacterium]|nr:YciI family protein [Ignavibacteriales bacterium]
MQFIVIAYDGTDDKALERRMAVRESHLTNAQKMFDAGKWLYASAILDDEEKMIGSMIICDYPSREELNEQWLKNEAYITGNVWQKINIHRARVAKH